MNKKYKLLTEESIEHYGHKLFRIEALVDLPKIGVKVGDKGGFIEFENNLDAEIFGNAWIFGDARIFGNARIFGDAEISGNAWISGDAEIFGDARIFGNAEISGKLKCETGYYFAYKRKEWKVEEIELDDD